MMTQMKSFIGLKTAKSSTPSGGFSSYPGN